VDLVFRALADPTRRALLDELFARDGQTLVSLTARHDMTRIAVAKHLKILEDAGLIVSRRRGREKLHHLNLAQTAPSALCTLCTARSDLMIPGIPHRSHQKRSDLSGSLLGGLYRGQCEQRAHSDPLR